MSRVAPQLVTKFISFLVSSDHKDWDIQLPTVLHYYNNAPSDPKTHYTPLYLFMVDTVVSLSLLNCHLSTKYPASPPNINYIVLYVFINLGFFTTNPLGEAIAPKRFQNRTPTQRKCK